MLCSWLGCGGHIVLDFCIRHTEVSCPGEVSLPALGMFCEEMVVPALCKGLFPRNSTASADNLSWASYPLTIQEWYRQRGCCSGLKPVSIALQSQGVDMLQLSALCNFS